MNEAIATAYLAIWFVCVIAATAGLITLLNHGRKKDPEGYQNMVRRTKRGSRWVLRTYLFGPARDFWDGR